MSSKNESPVVHFNGQTLKLNLDAPLDGYRDLFGELIPPTPVKNVPKAKKSAKKTPAPKKKKSNHIVPWFPRAKTEVFIPSRRIAQPVKNTQTTLSAMNKSAAASPNKSVESNDSLDMSGIQWLICPTVKLNYMKQIPLPIFKGVHAFIDYKMDKDRSGRGVRDFIIRLGGEVEKTFNRKVTHVVFRDGFPKTYKTAMERKIPLVSAMWVEGSRIANKLMDPADFPPVDMERYQEPKEYKFKFNFKKADTFSSIIIPGERERDQKFLAECLEFMKNIKPTPKRTYTKKEIEEKTAKETVKTPEPQTPIKNKVTSTMPFPDKKSPMPTGTINVLAKHIHNVLDGITPVPEETHVTFPMAIKLLRKILTPDENRKRPSAIVNSELVEIEDHLKLNSEKRQHLRKLLFHSTYPELLNMDMVGDLSSPSL